MILMTTLLYLFTSYMPCIEQTNCARVTLINLRWRLPYHLMQVNIILFPMVRIFLLTLKMPAITFIVCKLSLSNCDNRKNKMLLFLITWQRIVSNQKVIEPTLSKHPHKTNSETSVSIEPPLVRALLTLYKSSRFNSKCKNNWISSVYNKCSNINVNLSIEFSNNSMRVRLNAKIMTMRCSVGMICTF